MKSETDWKRFDELQDEDIDFSDIPEFKGTFFQNAKLHFRKASIGKEQVISIILFPFIVFFLAVALPVALILTKEKDK